MRKFYTIISAIILALFLAGLFFWMQGNNPKDLLPTENSDQTLDSPATPDTPEVTEVNLTYDEHIAKGDEYLKQSFLTLAGDEYAKAAALEPEQIIPYLKLTQVHLALRNYDKAEADTQAVLKKDPSNQEAQLNQIIIKIKLSDFNAAKNLLDAQSQTTNPEMLYYQGLIASLFNDQALAKQTLNAALQNGPSTSLTTKINRVLTSYQEFDATQAGEELYLNILLAKSFNENEEYEMAIQLLKEILKTRGDLRDGWILLGFSYLNLQNYPFALTALNKAYSIDPTWTTTQYFLGITNKELGNNKDAITYFTAALNGGFEPKVVIENHLADLYFETRNYQKAAEAYQAVLEVNKQDVNAFVRPIWLYLDYLNSPEKALQLAQSAAITFPNEAMSYNLLGWSYIGMGDYNNADANLKKAISLNPNLAAAYLNLGLLNEKWGKNDLALEYYQKAYNLDQKGSIGNTAATNYNNLIKKTMSETSEE